MGINLFGHRTWADHADFRLYQGFGYLWGVAYRVMIRAIPLFLLMIFMAAVPALAEICPPSQIEQARREAAAEALGQNKNTQFILAEVQNSNYECGMYQRFYISKADVDGDTAYAISRFLYFVFGDERVLSFETDPQSVEQARVAYFFQMGATPRPIPIHMEEGVITMIPPSAQEIAASPEYQPLRSVNPAALQQIMQYHTQENFDQLNAAALNFLRQHWNVQSVAVPAPGDCGGA